MSKLCIAFKMEFLLSAFCGVFVTTILYAHSFENVDVTDELTKIISHKNARQKHRAAFVNHHKRQCLSKTQSGKRSSQPMALTISKRIFKMFLLFILSDLTS